jgi:hypothetical protein
LPHGRARRGTSSSATPAATSASFNSCRNRHCPKCQSLVRAQWLEERHAELLPVEYFHVVFTLPQEIAAIAYQNKAVVYDILFRATAETLRTIAADPKHLGAEIGFIAILHTWGQNLLHHPHLHCVVPGGGLSPMASAGSPAAQASSYRCGCCRGCSAGCSWRSCSRPSMPGSCTFFNALAELRAPRAFARYLAPVRQAEWVVYAKPPFGGPERVLEYLGRYTHRVAIANSRLTAFADGRSAFAGRTIAMSPARR